MPPTITSTANRNSTGDRSRPGVIALITEGTYPAHQGGVSVWCDQLIRGLPEFRFDVHAITGTGLERSVWKRPANLNRTLLTPIWGAMSTRPRHRREFPDFAAAHQHFVAALLADDVDLFIGALKDLRRYSEQHDLTAALTSEAALRRLHESWLAAPDSTRASVATHAPSVADAVHAGALLEHLLRALSADVPPADIYHASSNGLASLIAMVGKWKYDAPFILTEHGIYLRERYMALGYRDATYPVRMLVLRFVRLLTSAAYLVADLITPGSRYNRRWQERNGADPAKVRPIHNGVDHREFPDAGPEPAAPTLVWVGRIDPLKDLETLIRAADIVRKHIPNFRLRMYGSVPVGNEAYAERCQALLDRLDLAGHARFEGRIPVILDAYSAASVVVLSSRSEGFPYTVIEAMMSGRATVSTDVGGVGEAVGDAGLVVPPRDPKAFAEACIDLLQDHKRRYLLSQAARVRALKYFTLQQFLGIYREIYLELGATPVPEAVLAAGEPRDDPAEFVGLESVPAT